MAEGLEVVGGQPDTQPTPAPAAPAVEPAPVQPQPTVVPKYAGKTMEQLAQEMEDKDRYISEVNERAARAEHEAQLTRNLVEQFARDRGKPQETTPAAPEVSDDEFLTNPAKATAKIIDGYLQRDRVERERERAEQTIYQARTAFEQGRQKAISSNPNLFRGIETELANQLTNTVAQGIRNGQQVDVDTLRDEKYWRTAAVAMRMARGEDPVKILSYLTPQAPAHTVAPVHTEVPSPGAAPQGTSTLTPEQESAARMGGFTREQFIENLGKVRAETQWRQK
jgi:hypothetical protein